MKSSQNIDRDVRLDLLRGILILLVLLGHDIQYVYSPIDFDENIVFRLIYSFHMPLFMFLSGYAVKMRHNKMELKWVCKRFLSLLIPFLIWGLIYSLIFENSFFDILIKPDKGLWFFWALAFITLLVYIAEKISAKIGFIAFVLMNIILVLIPCNILGIPQIKIHYTWFLFGYFANSFLTWLNSFPKTKKIILWIGIIGWPLTVIFWMRTEAPIFSKYFVFSGVVNSMVNIFYYMYRVYLVPLLGIIFAWTIWNKIWRFLDCKVLRYIGNHTTEIYILQGFFWFSFCSNSMINAIVSFILGLGISLFMGWILRKWQISSFLFLGTIPKRNRREIEKVK